MTKLKVKFVKKLFENEETGYSVLSAEPVGRGASEVPLNSYGTFSVSGEFSLDDSSLGAEVFEISIEEDYTSKYRNSWKLVQVHYDFPSDPKEQWRYLSEYELLTKTQIKNLKAAIEDYENYDILNAFIEKREELLESKGIAMSRLDQLSTKIKGARDNYVIFKEFGHIPSLTPGVISKIIKWKPDVSRTAKRIKEDPFCILKINGIGFTIADSIRNDLGIPHTDKSRCLHGVKYFTEETFASTGDTYMTIEESLSVTSKKLAVPASLIFSYLKEESGSDALSKTYDLKLFGKYLSTVELNKAEGYIFSKVGSLLEKGEPMVASEEWASIKERVLSKHEAELSSEQDDFLNAINENKILVLLGPGGAGKSWVTKLACEMITKSGHTYGLYAPTAKAAKVMSNYTKDKAMTIHRGLLSYDGGKAGPSNSNDDVIIVDEASMIDSVLMQYVLMSMKPDARIVIIGDSFQLPSVSPGNILYDFTNYLSVPTVKFTKVFRQGKDSNILNMATALREKTFSLDLCEDLVDLGDIKFVSEDDASESGRLALEQYELLKGKYKPEDLMLLTPVNKGDSGRVAFNRRIQKVVNGKKLAKNSEMNLGSAKEDDNEKVTFRKGDYITIKRNDYEATTIDDELSELINGDLGYVRAATPKYVTVEVNSEKFTFNRTKAQSTIEHVWSTTIHKSQGGQAKAVIIVIPKNSRWSMSANMLYTAITRAQVECYVVGSFETINASSKKIVNQKRKTMLSLKAHSKG